MAFLALVTDQGGRYEVVVLHRMMRYMDSPGDDPSGYHHQVLGLLGDIMPHQFLTVEVPGNAFHLIGMPARVPTIEAMAALIPTWDDATPTLGPYTEEAGETEVVRPRHVQIVPSCYAAILVHRGRLGACALGVHPKIAYQEIVGAIQARGELADCQDIVTWLRAACTALHGEAEALKTRYQASTKY